MTSYAELVLLFDTEDLTNIKGQLDERFDEFSVAGDVKHIPSMVLVRKDVWIKLEYELQQLMESSRPNEKVVPFQKAPARRGMRDPELLSHTQPGYNALVYRSRPIVAVTGANIVADRVGANSHDNA